MPPGSNGAGTSRRAPPLSMRPEHAPALSHPVQPCPTRQRTPLSPHPTLPGSASGSTITMHFTASASNKDGEPGTSPSTREDKTFSLVSEHSCFYCGWRVGPGVSFPGTTKPPGSPKCWVSRQKWYVPKGTNLQGSLHP